MSVTSQFRTVFALLLISATAYSASAATITWTGGAAPDPNWSNMANWDAAVGLDNDIIFDTTIGGDVAVDVNPVVSTIVFDNAAAELYTLTINNGQTLSTESIANNSVGTIQTITGPGSLTSAANLAIGGTDQLTIDAPITGALAITKSGASTLQLDSASTYSGGTILDAGTLSLGNDLALGSDDLTINGGTLFGSLTPDEINNEERRSIDNNVVLGGNFAINNTAEGGMDIAGDVDLGGATREITVEAGGNSTWSGVVSNGAITKEGPGVLFFDNANTYEGDTTLEEGILTAGHDQAFGTVGKLNINGGKIVGFSTPAEVAASQGRTIANDPVIGDDFAIDNTDGSFINFTGDVDLTGGNRMFILEEGAMSTFSGVIDNGAITKDGDGTLWLTGVNTYADGTTLNSGTLGITTAASLGTGDLNINGGTIETTDADITINTDVFLDGDFTYSGDVDDPKSMIFDGNTTLNGDSGINVLRPGSSGRFVINSNIDDGGNDYDFTKSGLGTLQLTGTNTLATLIMDGGILELSGGNTIPDDSELQANEGTTEIIDSETIGRLTSTGTNGTVNIPVNQTLTVAGTADGTYKGALTGPGSLVKAGASMQGLHGDSSAFTGDTTLQDGTLSIGHNNALGSGTLTIEGGTIFGSLTVDEIAAGDRRTISNPLTVASDFGIDNVADGSMDLAGDVDLGAALRTVTVEADGDSNWSGEISDGGIIKQGPGKLAISGDNSGVDGFDGGVTLDDGTLGLGNNNAIAKNILTINGGTLHGEGVSATVTAATAGEIEVTDDFGLSTEADGTLELTDNVDLNAATRTITVAADSNAVLSGVVDNGGVIADGDGTLTFSGVNTYADGTQLTGGKVVVTNADSLGTGDVTLNGGKFGTADADVSLANNLIIDGDFGFEADPDAVTATPPVSATLTLDGSATLNADSSIDVAKPGNGTNDALIINGVIDDGLGSSKISKTGDGTLVLNNANTFDGGVDINAGVLQIGNDAALGTGDVTMQDTTVLSVDVPDAVTPVALANNIIIADDATANIGGPDALTINGTVTGTNANTTLNIIGAGGVTTGAADLLADDLGLSIAGGATVTLGGADAIGSLSGGGDLELGTQNLDINSGTGDFSGELLNVVNIEANGGEQTISGDQTIDGDVNVAAGATLALSGANSIAGTVNVSGTLLAADGALNDDAVTPAPIVPILANDATVGAATASEWSTAVDISALVADEGFNADTTNGDTTVTDLTFTENLTIDQTGNNMFTIDQLTSEADGIGETLTVNSGTLNLTGLNIDLVDAADIVTAAGGARINLNGTLVGLGDVNAGAGTLFYGENAVVGVYNLDAQTGLSASLGAVNNVDANVNLLGDTVITGGGAVNFNAGAGNTLDLGAADRTIDVEGTTVLAINSLITSDVGTEALNKTGAGTMNITGDQTTFTGPITSDMGTLQLSGQLGGNVVITGGALYIEAANVIDDAAGKTLTIGDASIVALNAERTIDADAVITNDISVDGNEELTFAGAVDLSTGDQVVTISDPASVVFGGAVSNGNLELPGDGEASLQGTMTGNLTNSGSGTVGLASTMTGNLTNSGSGNVDLTSTLTGNLTSSGTSTTQFATGGTITGNVTVSDTSTLLFTENNVIDGGGVLTIDGGRLQASNIAGVSLDNDINVNNDFWVNNGNKLTLTGTTTLAADSTVRVDTTADISVRDLTGANNLSIDTLGGTFEIGNSAAPGFVMAGFTGDIIITGENDGVVALNATIGNGTGQLTITGDASDDQVILMGVGNFRGNTTIGNNAIHAPGNSIGTQTINGDYTLATGSTLQIEIDTDLDAPFNSDLVNVVGGDITFEVGTTIDVVVNQGNNLLTEADQFVFMTTDQNIVVIGVPTYTDDSDFYDFSATDNAATGEVILLVNVINNFTSLANSANNFSIAAALEDMIPTANADQKDMLVELQTMNAEDYNLAVHQLNANPFMVGQQSSKRIINSSNGYLTSRLEARRTGMDGLLSIQSNSIGDAPVLFASAAIDPEMFILALDDQANRQISDRYRISGGYPTASPYEWQMYGRFFGVFDRQDSTTDYLGYDSDSSGIMLGLDRQIKTDTIFGAMFSYDRADVTYKEARGTAEINTFRAGPYWSWEFERSFVDFSGTFGYHTTDSNRVATIGALEYTPTSSYNAWDVALYAGTGFTYKIEHWWLVPAISMQYQYYNQDGFSESEGGGATLDVDSWSNHSFQSHVGIRTNRIFNAGDLTIVPEMGFGWLHEFLEPSNLGSNFTGQTTPITFTSGDHAKDSLTYALGLSALLNEQTTLFVRFDGEFHKDGSTNVVSAGFTFRN